MDETKAEALQAVQETAAPQASARGRKAKQQTLRPLELLYQQIYDLRENEIHGYEAEIRINDRALGTLTPAVFVPIAEKSNRIVELGKWSFVEAADMMRRQGDNARKIKRLFLTVSPKYVTKRYFLDNVTTQLAKAEMEKERLCIQLTATAVAEKQNGLKDALLAVREAGLKTVLTGWGEQALSPVQLAELPFDYLKLDEAVTASFAEDERIREILNGTAQMCEKLGIRMIAAGVSQKQQLSFLEEIGCVLMQGDYFGAFEREREIF